MVERLAEITPPRNPQGSWAKQPGLEPLPGYRLLAPLGRGGFGEVWTCVAPGGLLKAVKFVQGDAEETNGNGALAEQEWAALQRIKAIRHPFLLSMERVEVVAGELIIVMELADKSLLNLLTERQAAGLPGIPRPELLAYLREAAEALDVLNLRHGLQHLDVKPANLFLVSDHVKVADFGLVQSLSDGQSRQAPAGPAGFTPRYSAPETLQGCLSLRGDQYSLAIVYQELLTGVFPFQGKTGRQLMLQHLTADPDLAPLPAGDRPVVARALAKEPDQRFSSCLDFLQALAQGADSSLARPRRGFAQYVHPRPVLPERHRADLVTAPRPSRGLGAARKAPPGPRLPAVLPVARLTGAPLPAARIPAREKLVTGLLALAAGSAEECLDRGFRYFLRSGNVLEHRCAVRMFPGGLRLKLDGFRRHWHADITRQDEGSVVFHLPAPRSFWQRCVDRQVGLRIQVQRQALAEATAPWAEVTVRVQPFGSADGQAAQLLADVGPTLLESVRAYLQAQPERRAAERWPFLHPLCVYPVASGSEGVRAIHGMVRDVCRGGIGLLVPESLAAEHVYVHLESAAPLAEFALLVRIVWSQAGGPNGWHQAGAVFPVAGAEVATWGAPRSSS